MLRNKKSMSGQTLLILLSLTLLLMGCSKTKPQSPSNKHSSSNDDVVVAMVMTNQRLAEQADRCLIEYIQQKEADRYSLQEAGYWLRKHKKTELSPLNKGDEADITIAIWELGHEKKLLTNTRANLIISESNFILPIWETLLQMKYGESAELLIPWYAAYGSTGTTEIPPYTNIIVEINIH